jgi:hypothetical protein
MMRVIILVSAVAVLFVLGACDGEEPLSRRIASPTPTDAAELTDDDLERHGIYRIVPPGYTGERAFIDIGGSIDPGVSSSDPEVVRTSPLYLEIVLLPSDLRLVSLDTFDGGLNTVVRQDYMSVASVRRLEITRVRKGVDPIDVVTTLEPPPEFDAALFLQGGGRVAVPTLGFVAGHEAVIFTPIDELPVELQTSSVMFYQEGVNTTLIGHSLPVSMLLEIAEEIAAAADGLIGSTHG